VPVFPSSAYALYRAGFTACGFNCVAVSQIRRSVLERLQRNCPCLSVQPNVRVCRMRRLPSVFECCWRSLFCFSESRSVHTGIVAGVVKLLHRKYSPCDVSGFVDLFCVCSTRRVSVSECGACSSWRLAQRRCFASASSTSEMLVLCLRRRRTSQLWRVSDELQLQPATPHACGARGVATLDAAVVIWVGVQTCKRAPS
jgi:hypothetical protein